MLQKPDIKNLNHLEQIDKERLMSVWEVIEKEKIKFPVAAISKKIKWSKGNISGYLNGVIALSENFYSNFMDKFSKGSTEGDNSKEPDNIGKESFYVETITDLRKSGIKLASANEETATANRVLAEAQRDLIQVLKVIHKPTADAAKGTREDIDFLLDPYLDKMAGAGVGKYWDSVKQGRAILGKLLSAGQEPKEG